MRGDVTSAIQMAQTGEPHERTLAFSVLVQSVRTPRTPQVIRDKVKPVLDAAWSDPVAAPSLVQAVRVMKVESQYTDRLAAYDQLTAAKTAQHTAAKRKQ
jgi:hypothetical protein